MGVAVTELLSGREFDAKELKGKVIAIDYDQNAVDLTKKNLQKFELSNVSVILGNAKEKISELEQADAIFVGGTGGDTKEIVELSEKKLKAGGRIVIGIILIETLYSVMCHILVYAIYSYIHAQ